MKERKYKEEYKLITQLDEKTGKPRQVPVYMGDHYELGVETPRGKLLTACGAWLTGFAACYGAYMMMASPSSYCIYVLPFACCAVIPLLYACMGAVGLARAPERMTRVQRETGIGRLMRSFMGCAVCTTLAALCDGIFMLRNGAAGETLAALLLAASGVLAWMGFARMRAAYSAMTVHPGKAAQEAHQAGQRAGEQA